MSLLPFPLTSTMRWHQVASPETLNYWASFSKASKDFQGGLIFPCGRGATHLFCYGIVPFNCLRRQGESGEIGQQMRAPMSLLSGEIYGPLYWNQSELQFMEKKNQYCQGLFQRHLREGSQGAIFCLDAFPWHNYNFF